MSEDTQKTAPTTQDDDTPDFLKDDAPEENTEEKSLTTIDEKYLRDNARVGLEDIAPEDLPTPTVILVQKNSDLTDEEDRPLPRGKFFYRGDGRIMDKVECSILSVTKTELPDFVNKEEMNKTFVLLGALEPDWKPFIMYMNKTKLQAVRQFLGQVSNSQMPMYAQKVVISSQEIDSQKGSFYVPIIQLVGLRKEAGDVVLLEEMAKTYGARIKDQIKEVEFTE